MKKQKIQMLVLLGVLLLLCGTFLGVKKYNQKQAEKPEETDQVVVIDVSTEDIVRFSYDYEGETYAYEKEDDTWYYAPDHSLKLLQYRTGNLMSGLAPLKTGQVIEDVYKRQSLQRRALRMCAGFCRTRWWRQRQSTVRRKAPTSFPCWKPRRITRQIISRENRPRVFIRMPKLL